MMPLTSIIIGLIGMLSEKLFTGIERFYDMYTRTWDDKEEMDHD